MNATLTAPILFGPGFGLRWALNAGSPLTLFGLAEIDTTDAILAVLSQGTVFFDIGAGCGYQSLIASRVVGKAGNVYAFEDSQPTLERLRTHVERNRAANITIVATPLDQLKIDAWIEQNRLPLPQSMHIRAPGFEPALLRSASMVLTRARPALVLESTAKTASLCSRVMQSYGYSLTTCPSENPSSVKIVALPN